MFLLIASYSKALEEVTPHAAAHAEWVKQHIDAGTFLFAGPKKSKLGGAILVKSMGKEQLNAILATDSYVKADVAEYQIIDFDCKLTNQDLTLLQSA